MTTDAAQDWLKAQIAEGKEKLITSKAAKDMLRAYQILSNNLEPDQKDTIGDILNTFAAALPKGKLGAGISASGIRATKDSLRDRVLDQTNNAVKSRDAELKLPKAMQNITNKDEEILSAVITVPTIAGLTIGKSASPDRIIGSLNSEIRKLGNKLTKVLVNPKLRGFTKQDMIVLGDSAIDRHLATRQGTKYRSDQMKSTVTAIQDAYESALANYNGKPLDMLKFRQDFDDNIETFLSEQAFQGNDLVTVVRQSLNDALESVVGSNESAKALLRRQHLLRLARNNTSAFKITKGNGAVDSIVKGVKAHPFLALSAAGGTGVASDLFGSQSAYLGAAGLLGAYGLAQPVVRRGAGTVLNTLPVARSGGMLYSPGMGQEQEQ